MADFEIYYADIWNKTLNLILKTGAINNDVFDMYFTGSKIKTIENNKVVIYAPQLINLIIMRQHEELIQKCLSEELQVEIEVEIIGPNDLKDEKTEEEFIKEIKKPLNIDFWTSLRLDPTFTFSTFVVGKSNAQAHAASYACAKNPGFVYNPLFIYGNSGIGKTHLLNAIGNDFRANFPNKKVGFISGLGFVEAVYKATKENLYDELKASFRDVDLLLVDDIQFIADKPKSHEIFFNLFNDLVNNKKQICLTSDKAPEDINGLEKRLVTRFNQGLTVNIEAPEYETAVNIIKLKIQNNLSVSQQLDIDDEVIDYIATNFSSDVRSLEGAINSLLLYQIMYPDNDKITINMATEVFKDRVQQNKNELTINKIRKIVCDYYNLSKEQIIGKNRTKNIVNARHIAIYLCRTILDATYDEIGKEFGKRDHSTIISSCEKVESLIKTDPLYHKVINEIESKLH